MRFRTGLFFSIITLSFILARAGLAQETEEGTATFDLGEIVITPTTTETTIGDLSLSASVVTSEEIEASTANSATDILSILPGVFVHKTGPFGRADVVIRGQGSRGRRVMVLVDGKPEKMGLYGCTITHALPLDNVERIEVVRGPASVLYGSDAIGGVINIITKKAEKKCEGDVTLSYGSYDTQVYRLRQGGKFENFDYYFTFDKRQSRGHLPNSDYNDKNYSLRLGSDLNDNLYLVFNSRYFEGFAREPSPATADTWNDYKRGSFDLTLNADFDETTGMLKVYRNFGRHLFSDGWHSKDYTTGVMFHTSFTPLADNTLTLGTEFREQGGEVLNGGIKGKYDKDEFAFFLHDEQRLLDEKLIASAGVRYNDDEFAGDIVCPQAGLVFHVMEGTTLRTSANKGFRAPQLNELKFYASSNPDLNPETSWNYEVGLNQQIGPSANFDIAYFIMHAKNFIRFSSGKFRNIDKVDFKGLETTLEYIFSRNLTSRLSFTHLHTGKYTQGRPQNELDLALFYQKDKFTLSLVGQCVDNYFAADNKEEPIPNFFLLNTKLIYDVSSALDMFVGIDNLLNVEHKIYTDLPGSAAGVYTQPGRTFSVGATYKW